jgi:hypothetical protein
MMITIWRMKTQPELNRHEFLIISFQLLAQCLSYSALLAYNFRKRTEELALNAEYIPIESAKEWENCEALIQRGLIGSSLEPQFQPSWKR